LTGLHVGNRDRCIALVGTIHAGESGPELAIPAVERLLAEHPALLARAGIALLPNVNVDERERMARGCPWYLRTNARGVDLNRNFDADWEQVDYSYGLVSSDPDAVTYRGPGPHSEPETQAVAAFLHAAAPRAVLAYHWLAGITGARFLAPRAAANDDAYAAACRRLVEPFVAAFYPEQRWQASLIFSTSAGSLPNYVYRTFGVPAFDLEGDDNPDEQPAVVDQTTPELLRMYQERHYRGLNALLTACAEGG
ncbi:MAG: M14 family metallopeptidase, partial [Armatimonadota bacterium]